VGQRNKTISENAMLITINIASALRVRKMPKNSR
jgi:hypothetical protein